MTDVSWFIAGLRTINFYHFSGSIPREASVQLSTPGQGGMLTLLGRRSGLFIQKTEGNLTTPFGNIVFSGTRSFTTGKEDVLLTNSAGSASGQLIFPRFWGMLSCFNRAELRVTGNANLSFDIWKPTVRFQETLGRFRQKRGKVQLYRLFSQSTGDRMFPDEAEFAQMEDDSALVLLAGLLYFCMYPESVVDRGE